MNAVIDTEATAPLRVAPHSTHKFKLLLKREFWEHKGGFFWAPIWAASISLVLATMVIVTLLGFAHHASPDGVQVDGQQVMINGLDLSLLTSKLDADGMRNVAGGIDIFSMASTLWPMVVLVFVVFFYCLGNLYDERKDRSVLFWKSLPVSDRDTVLSKAVSALVVAPSLAVSAAIACMFGHLLLISVVALLYHGNPYTLIWGPGSPLKVAASLVAMIPVYALWALPTVGWLMLCSAWARSKPFLWAILIPLFSGIVIAWFKTMNLFHLDAAWFWRYIVGRGLLSVIPGSWYANPAMHGSLQHIDNPGDFVNAIQIGKSWAIFGTVELWVGAFAGAAMIFAAIRLRRWRDDN